MPACHLEAGESPVIKTDQVSAQMTWNLFFKLTALMNRQEKSAVIWFDRGNFKEFCVRVTSESHCSKSWCRGSWYLVVIQKTKCITPSIVLPFSAVYSKPNKIT